MERRNFLKAGVLAGGSMGLGSVGCGAVLEGMSAVPVPSLAELQALDMDGFLKRLDTSLGFIQSTSTLDKLVPREVQRGAAADPRFERSEELVRKTLRSLLLTGSFGDLPEAGRAHPGMQARLWSSMQDMDDAVLGMNRTMTSLSPTERSDIGRVLREDATVAPRILEALDDEAVKAGVTDRRREHMREVGKHACFRLRQSTSLFIDEYDDKVKKVAARDATVEHHQRRLMAQLGEDAFWDYHRRQTALAAAWQQVPGVAQAGAPPAVTANQGYGTSPTPLATGTTVVYPQYQQNAPLPYVYPTSEYDEEGRSRSKLRTGTILLGVGGGLLGLGLLAGVTGAFLVADPGGQIGGYFVITAAALLGLGGIACLIAGGIIRARA